MCLTLNGLNMEQSKKILNNKTISNIQKSSGIRPLKKSNMIYSELHYWDNYDQNTYFSYIHKLLSYKNYKGYNHNNGNLFTYDIFGEIVKCQSYNQKWDLLFETYYNHKDDDYNLLLPSCFKSIEWLVHVERIVWDQKNDKQRFRIEWIDDSITFIDFYKISLYNNDIKIHFHMMKRYWSIIKKNLESLKVKNSIRTW